MRRDSQVLRNRSRGAAFLCYHSIARNGLPHLSIDPELFERQLAALRRWGFSGGGHEDLADIVAGLQPRRRLVFLTFDDGYRDNHSHALPLLREYGFKALVYLLPPYVDSGGELDWPELRPRKQGAAAGLARSITWEMAGEMSEAGIEFGSHTNTHSHLARLGGERLREELLDSRRTLTERLGRCDSIAYPFGHWSAEVALAARECGYRFGFTVPSGAQKEATALSIPRVSVDHRDTEARFRLKLTSTGRRVLLSPAKQGLRRVRATVGRMQ